MKRKVITLTWEKSSIISIDLILNQFGLKRSLIYETIISTMNSNEKIPHAAPMGIIFEDDSLIIKPYKTSRTYQFMVENKFSAINFIDDLELFYIFSHEDKDMNKLSNYFQTISEFKSPIFKDTDLSIEVKILEDLDKEGVRANFKCEPINYLHKTNYNRVFEPVNRAKGCILESIIHFTRISLFRKINSPDLLKRVDDLIYLLKHYRRVIKKVHPQSRYSWIIDDIFEKLKI